MLNVNKFNDYYQTLGLRYKNQIENIVLFDSIRFIGIGVIGLSEF